MSTKPLLGSSRCLATYFFFWQIVEIFFNGSLEELGTPEFFRKTYSSQTSSDTMRRKLCLVTLYRFCFSSVILFQECTQPLSLYRSLKWWNMVPIGVRWFLTRTGPCATAHLEAGGFIRSREGMSHPNIQYHFLPSAFKDHGRVTVEKEAFQVSDR